MDILAFIRKQSEGNPILMCELLKVRRYAKALAQFGGMEAVNQVQPMPIATMYWNKLAASHDSCSNPELATTLINNLVADFNY